MSDNDRSVRRLGRSNRKTEIKASGELFPPEPPPTLPEVPASLDAVGLPDLSFLDDQARDDLELLSALPEGLVARPLKIAPQAERFPPLETQTPRESVTTRLDAVPSVPPPSRQRIRTYNILTVLAVIGTLATCAIYGMIWQNPQTVFNPFPPPIVYVEVTATPLPATAPVFVSSTQISPTLESLFPFVVSAEGVLYIANANERGCEWASIAGTVTTADARPLNGYRVRVSGEGMDETVFSGASLTFGEGGYELPLGGSPIQRLYTVQLFSPQGAPLSEPLEVQTQASCEQNVAIVNFKEN